MHLGGHAEGTSSSTTDDTCFDPKLALVTLTQTSTELGNDFILIVKCDDLSFPHTLLEKHATIPNSKALMVTLVPRFNLPEGPKPEIVFVVDRSASMENRIAAVKLSLGIFLKSLPVQIKFNICSFGSSCSLINQSLIPPAHSQRRKPTSKE